MFPHFILFGWTIQAYGLMNAVAFLSGILWLKRHRARMGLNENAFWAGIWCLLLGAVAGAKALFVALAWEYYASGRLHLITDFRYGFVYFGGLLGAALAGWAFARRCRLSFVRGADYFAVAVPMGHAIGRLGCLAAGCCHGSVTTLPWAVSLTDPACLVPAGFRGLPLHPVQLYEAAGLVAVAWACRWSLRKVEAGLCPEGTAFRLYLVLYGLLRVSMDLFRGDGRPERLLGISFQQGMALACLLVAACLSTSTRETKPGASAPTT
ncbi:MAG: prolipoprotein diacylglyceryl transferase [Elusimicrobia bacterium]|nr:prolipoprotein diacylglyceryl transferase [Elusimicrobiota bacterium]